MLAKPQTQSNASGVFPDTHWTLISRVQLHDEESADALEKLCQQYWRPVYLYARRSGFSSEDAEDLTQGFFERALRSQLFQSADSKRGRLRTLLLTAFQRHSISEWRRETRQKRAGNTSFRIDENLLSAFPVPSHVSPQEAYDQAWILEVVRGIENEIYKDYTQRGRGELFLKLWPLVENTSADAAQTSSIALASGMNQGAVRTALHRLRTVYRRHLETAIINTLENPADLEDELRYLLGLLGKEGFTREQNPGSLK